MIYSAGTIAVTSGLPTVTGTGTKWKKRVNAGDVFQLTSSGAPYLISAVLSDTSLRLAEPYAAGTETAANYVISSDFSRFYSIPYPNRQDVDKASVLRRSINRIDKVLDSLSDRVFLVEYPPGSVIDISATPSIGTVYIAGPPGGVVVVNMASTPEITSLEVSTPGTISVQSMTSTPVITTVSVPSPAGLVTADSATVTADSAIITASGGSKIPSNIVLASSAFVTADSNKANAAGLYTP
jgi:hypothetical protein